MCALFARTYIDPNRAEDDFDPLLLAPGALAEGFIPSRRAEHGIGLVHRLADQNTEIYDRRLSIQEIQSRIENFYSKYHNALSGIFKSPRSQFDTVIHVNCHAMPSKAALPHRPVDSKSCGRQALDFSLGNKDGNTCDPGLLRQISDFLRSMGYTVGINDPYKGAEIVKRYGSPLEGINSLHLEINKALYMDEVSSRKNKAYNKTKQDIEKLVRFIVSIADHGL